MEPAPQSKAKLDPMTETMASFLKPKAPPAPPVAENAVKVTMDGQRLQVAANVDAKGARKLMKAIEAYLALLEDDEPAN